MTVYDKDCFHVHTYRCGHAENIPDEKYLKAALDIGATGIWFTDHAPFPGDPFGNRMNYSELDEYLSSLSRLREKYKGQISVYAGLEIEYFPSFDKIGYYKQLCADPRIDILLLGQHMAETGDGYTFSWDEERLNREEYVVLGNAEIQGIESGYFDAVAHLVHKKSNRIRAVSIIQNYAEYLQHALFLQNKSTPPDKCRI